MAFSEYNSALISSNRVQGTDVYSTEGDWIGELDHLMFNKQSGHVVFAVVAFGGFLGLGQSYYPLPWEALKYDTRRGGYVTGVTADQLRDSPAFSPEAWEDKLWPGKVRAHYGLLPEGSGT